MYFIGQKGDHTMDFYRKLSVNGSERFLKVIPQVQNIKSSACMEHADRGHLNFIMIKPLLVLTVQ